MRRSFKGRHGERKHPSGSHKRRMRGSYLIVCEGEKTEPYYFNAFKKKLRVRNIEIKVKGTGFNTWSLVDAAERFNNEESQYDNVWCVFDHDSFPEKNIHKAFAQANKYHPFSL